MNITHISVSRKSVWDQCKMCYKYKYHLKTESEEDEPFYFVYGKIIHKIAEEYVLAKGSRQLQEVTNAVVSGEIPIESYEGVNTLAPPIPLEYKKRMPGHLASVGKITEQMGYDGELEWSFSHDLDPPNQKLVVGFIDRLIRKGDKFWILDYKTTKKGKYRKNHQTIKSDLQLRCYARIVQKTFDVPAENIKTALYYLEGSNLIGARYSDAQLLAAEKELLDCYNQIKSYDPDRVLGTVGYHCARCDYRKPCPFYNGR